MQVLKKDYVAAGLCCIQLFLNSSHQDQALGHLERAKVWKPFFWKSKHGNGCSDSKPKLKILCFFLLQRGAMIISEIIQMCNAAFSDPPLIHPVPIFSIGCMI